MDRFKKKDDGYTFIVPYPITESIKIKKKWIKAIQETLLWEKYSGRLNEIEYNSMMKSIPEVNPPYCGNIKYKIEEIES